MFSLSITVTALPQIIAQKEILSTSSLFSHNSTVTNDFLTYSNFAYGIKIKYPYGWEQRENTGELINFPADFIVEFYSPKEKYLSNYPAELSISVSRPTLLNQYLLHAINDIKANSNLKLIGSHNITIANHPAYKLVYEQAVDTGRNVSIRDVTKIFVKRSNTLYNITYVTQESSRNYSEYIKTGQKMIDSFEISFARTFNPPITIDGKMENGEWKNVYSEVPGLIRIPESFSLTLFNRTELLPTTYNITLRGIGDDKNMYLLVKIKGPPTSKADAIIELLSDPGAGQINDMLRIYPASQYANGKSLFEDGFRNNTTNRFQDDTRYGGTRDGFAGISFSNGTEILEVSHPLCSGDKSDLCVSPDTTVGISFMLNTTDDSAIWNPSARLAFSGALGLYFQQRAGALITEFVPPASFILDIFSRLSLEKHAGFLDNLTSEEQNELLTSPTQEEVEDFLINRITVEELRDFLINRITAKDLDALFNSVSKDDILKRIGPEDREAVSDKLSSIN